MKGSSGKKSLINIHSIKVKNKVLVISSTNILKL